MAVDVLVWLAAPVTLRMAVESTVRILAKQTPKGASLESADPSFITLLTSTHNISSPFCFALYLPSYFHVYFAPCHFVRLQNYNIPDFDAVWFGR